MPSTLVEWVDLFGAIGTVMTPFLLLLILIVYRRSEAARRRAERLEEEIRDDRLEIYNEILNPFILLLTPGTAPEEQEKASEKMQSANYRWTAFKLSLFASDDVVRAYNRLMQFFYNYDPAGASDKKEAGIQGMKVFGGFLLEIRKSVGNEASSLEALEMLKWLIRDLE